MIILYDQSVSYKRDKYDNKDFGDIDASIVTTHMMLEAQDLGLGTTWIGYPSLENNPSKLHFQRKAVSSFVYWNKF